MIKGLREIDSVPDTDIETRISFYLRDSRVFLLFPFSFNHHSIHSLWVNLSGFSVVSLGWQLKL